jgi:hypothetical protein
MPLYCKQMKRTLGIVSVATLLLMVACIAAIATWMYWPARPDASQLVGHARKGDIVGVEYCLSQGIDPNAAEKWGWHRENLGQTPLTAAAQFGRVEVVRLLLRKGADANLRDCGSQFPHETPLSTAAMHGQIEVCKLLLEAGADPNIRTNPKDSNWTALDWALQAKQPAVAELLRQHGAVESGRRRAE